MVLLLPPGLGPFRGRDFSYVWWSHAVSQVGNWMEVATSAWLIYEMTASPILLGLTGAFRAGPTIALTLFGGALADRGSRKALLQAAQLLQLLAILALGILVASGQIVYWHFYVAAALMSSVNAFAQPTRMALYPSLVPREQLQNAVTLTGIPHRLSLMIGPALAGWIIATFGASSSYFVVAAAYMVAMASLSLAQMPALRSAPAASLSTLALGGLRYTLGHSLLPAVLLLEASVMLFGFNPTLMTVFARDILGVGAPGLGLLIGAAGAGAIAGSLTLIATGDIRRKGPVLLAAAAVYALSLVVFATSRLFALSLAVLFLLGVAESLWGTLRFSIIQLTTAEAYRGRVMSLLVIGFQGVTQLGQVQAGAAVLLFGAPGAALLGASAIGAVVLATAVRNPELRAFGSRTEAARAPAARS